LATGRAINDGEGYGVGLAVVELLGRGVGEMLGAGVGATNDAQAVSVAIEYVLVAPVFRILIVVALGLVQAGP
jgi:hypothetical protein